MVYAPASDAATRERRHCPHVGAASEFIYLLFYYFIFFYYGFAPTWLRFTFSVEPGRFGQNWVVSAESDCIGRRPKLTKRAEIAETGRNRP